MIRRNQQIIKALSGSHYRIFRIEYSIRGMIIVQRSEVLLDFGTNDANGMRGGEVQVSPY
jgi:hypothetical protein